ncbi:MAG: hypothetical protein DCC57_09540 [Chloroflexi bacterium]|nr:MAG: hypothetical protein DCC57_09540 [Chloroflexota bacterium]
MFPVVHRDQMQVQNLNSFEGRDAEGRIVDYYTDLVIYKDGREICRGKTTVNDPLGCAGYRFHQSTFSPDGVGLKVRDVKTGAVVYAEAPVLQREAAAPSPRFVVRDAAGKTLFDDFLVVRPLDDRRTIALVPVPGVEKVLPVVLFTEAGGPWQMSIVHLADRTDPNDRDYQITIDEGGSASDGNLTFSFPELRGLPALIVQEIPGIDPVAYLQLERAADGTRILNVMNVARPEAPTSWLPLREGEPLVAGDYEYTFEGPREYTGMLVKRDPGSWLIWVATALMMAGLAVTFYMPRRRVWVKVGPERTQIAGIAERMAHLSPELARLLARARREAGGTRADGL